MRSSTFYNSTGRNVVPVSVFGRLDSPRSELCAGPASWFWRRAAICTCAEGTAGPGLALTWFALGLVRMQHALLTVRTSCPQDCVWIPSNHCMVRTVMGEQFDYIIPS